MFNENLVLIWKRRQQVRRAVRERQVDPNETQEIIAVTKKNVTHPFMHKIFTLKS